MTTPIPAFARMLWLGAACVLAPAIAQAQPRTQQAPAPQAPGRQTLIQLLSDAYLRSPTLNAARAELRAVDETVPQALAGWRPVVTLSGTYGATSARSRSRVSPGDGPDLSLYSRRFIAPATGALTLSQPLYQGGRTTAATRRAESLVLAQRARLLETEQQVLLDAVQNFVAVFRDRELLHLYENNVLVLRQQDRAANRRLQAGEVTRTDALQAEARLAVAEEGLAAARGTLAQSEAAFERVAGSSPGPLQAPQPLRPVANGTDQLRDAASRESPAVAAALLNERAAREDIALQASTLAPQLSLEGQLFRSDNDSVRGDRATGQAVLLSLSVPIYQGGSEHAAVRQARETLQQARLLVDEQRRLAVQQALQAWESLQAARARLVATQRSIRALEGALDGVQREALLGARTTIDVLNAELELLNARTGLLQSAAEIVTASFSLAAATGRLTAQDLRLPVPLYDWETHYRAARRAWFGTDTLMP